MMSVRRTGHGEPWEFEVTIAEGTSETHHRVTMTKEMFERLGAGTQAPEPLVEAAFRFLLDREPKEQILGRFDISVISHYFPGFEQDLPRYLSRP